MSEGAEQAREVQLAQLQRRVNVARAGFDHLNAAKVAAGAHDGTPRYEPPAGWNQTAAISALVAQLAARGLIDMVAWHVDMLREMAETLETNLATAQADLLARYGLDVPLGSATRPQG